MKGENIINDAVKAPQENLMNSEQYIANETNFIHKGATVRLEFSHDGKSLDELLINYFKNLKRAD